MHVVLAALHLPRFTKRRAGPLLPRRRSVSVSLTPITNKVLELPLFILINVTKYQSIHSTLVTKLGQRWLPISGTTQVEWVLTFFIL